MTSRLSSVHGIDVQEQVLKVSSLLQRQDIKHQRDVEQSIDAFIDKIDEANLTDRGREDIYLSFVIGVSNSYNRMTKKNEKLPSPLSSRSLFKMSMKNPSRAGHYTTSYHSGNSPLKEYSVGRVESMVFKKSATAIAFSDISQVSTQLSKGSSDLPFVSTKTIPDTLSIDDYRNLYVAIARLIAYLGECS